MVLYLQDLFRKKECVAMLAFSIVCGVGYGVIVLLFFVGSLMLTGIMYEERVGPLLSEYQGGPDIFLVVPRMLGGPRCVLLFIFSLLWFIPSFMIFFLQVIYGGDVSLPDLPPWIQRTLLWIFLGFGKFTPAVAVGE